MIINMDRDTAGQERFAPIGSMYYNAKVQRLSMEERSACGSWLAARAISRRSGRSWKSWSWSQSSQSQLYSSSSPPGPWSSRTKGCRGVQVLNILCSGQFGHCLTSSQGGERRALSPVQTWKCTWSWPRRYWPRGNQKDQPAMRRRQTNSVMEESWVLVSYSTRSSSITSSEYQSNRAYQCARWGHN